MNLYFPPKLERVSSFANVSGHPGVLWGSMVLFPSRGLIFSPPAHPPPYFEEFLGSIRVPILRQMTYIVYCFS